MVLILGWSVHLKNVAHIVPALLPLTVVLSIGILRPLLLMILVMAKILIYVLLSKVFVGKLVLRQIMTAAIFGMIKVLSTNIKTIAVMSLTGKLSILMFVTLAKKIGLNSQMNKLPLVANKVHIFTAKLVAQEDVAA